MATVNEEITKFDALYRMVKKKVRTGTMTMMMTFTFRRMAWRTMIMERAEEVQ